MQKLTFRSIGTILEKPVRRKLMLLTVARIGANLLDLLGLAGIALLATAFGSLASGSATQAPLVLPIFGAWYIREHEAVLVALGVTTVFLAKSGFSIWMNLKTALLIARVETRNSKQIAEKFFNPASQEVADSESVSEFQNKVLNSTGAISSFLNARITLLAEVSLLAAMLGVFVYINPIATVSMFLFIGTVLVVLNRMIGKRLKINGARQMAGYEESLRVSRDLFGVRREAISGGVASHWISKFSKSRQEAAEGWALIYTLGSLPRYVIETSLILGIFAFIGGVVVISDLASQAVTIGVFLAGGLRLIASVLPLQTALVTMRDGANRGSAAYAALLDAENSHFVSSTEPNSLSRNPKRLTFSDVSFKFPGASKLVLAGVSFSVEPLTKVALVGKSGAGKSTIFELATGFLSPSNGRITYGDSEPRVVLDSSSAKFGIVPQRPHLIHGSIAENVSLESISSDAIEKVKHCLSLAGLDKFTTGESWWLRNISPDSGELSGGEIQRLGIARAIFRDPEILFLDEATSALDAQTEADITTTLDNLKSKMTIFLIAHRLSTVVNADKILYLDSGVLLGEGTFQELRERIPDFESSIRLLGIAER